MENLTEKKDISSELGFLKRKACEIRKMTLEEIGTLGVGHIGGAMSIVEVLTILYYRYMNIDPSNPKKEDRDLLVLSKGHAGPVLYSVLADKGYFPKDWLLTLNKGGTNLPSHCDMNRTPGIDMTTGSLGQGISAVVGMALANKLDKIDSNVYLIIGDGESNEGQVWEAAMAAAHYKLDNIIAFTDYNKMQIDGYTKDIMDVDNLVAKWEAFGWNTSEIKGHDFKELDDAIIKAQKQKGKPSMIILDTVKGKGVCFAEGKLENHNMNFDIAKAKEAIAVLESETE